MGSVVDRLLGLGGGATVIVADAGAADAVTPPAPTPPAPDGNVDLAAVRSQASDAATTAEQKRWASVLSHDVAKNRMTAATELLACTPILSADTIVTMLPKMGADVAPTADKPDKRTDAERRIAAATPPVQAGITGANDGGDSDKPEDPRKRWDEVNASVTAGKGNFFGNIAPASAR
jgi:hypothetical protein